jgi:RimJ/RimL family protein N-acetyltransferase
MKLLMKLKMPCNRHKLRRSKMESPILKTERLILKTLSDEDADKLFEYRSDPEVYRYQTWKPKTLGEAKDFIKKYTQEFNIEGTWFQLGIYEKERLLLIGDLGLHFLEPGNSQVEIGFTISKGYQRKGYGQEATKSVIGYLFKEMKKHRIVASVDPRNSASMALLENVGMRKEGHFKKSIWIDNQWVDDVIYAILEEEFI